ncbi:hypothetical protein KSP40_PGU012649 [Platanthera guangdongensis]|uniref:Uncharacterized protein n=1 Tax=Platanthera guangdongensis TaxID=2320717 RepID=A0ABR2N331_9ASPA
MTSENVKNIIRFFVLCGFDRLVVIFVASISIRDVIVFLKTSTARCALTHSIKSRPSSIEGCLVDIMIRSEIFFGIHTTEFVTCVCWYIYFL